MDRNYLSNFLFTLFTLGPFLFGVDKDTRHNITLHGRHVGGVAAGA